MQKIKRMPKTFGREQKGFTLIELLVVVAILGVLAVVAVPSVSVFIRDGKVEAQATELHDVQLAVVSAMTDANSDTCVAVAVGSEVIDMDSLGVDGNGDGDLLDAEDYLASDYMVGLDANNCVKGEWEYSCTAAGIVSQVEQ